MNHENKENKDLYTDTSYDKNKMYIEQLRSFVAFTKGQAEFNSTITSAASVMKVIAALRKSSDTNHWVDVVK